MLDKLRIHLLDSFKVDGDIIDFRIYDGLVFSEIAKLAQHTNKKVLGLDTFTGLGEPNSIDTKHQNFNEIKKGQYFVQEVMTRTLVSKNSSTNNHNIKRVTDYNNLTDISSDLFCFALVDLKQYLPTKIVLNYIWEYINYGGTIFITHFDESQNHSQFAAIKEFLLEHTNDVNVSRQMMVNGHKEKYIAIKCYNPQYKPINYQDFHTKNKVTIATVLKTGGPVYDYRYVNALAKAVKHNVTVDYEFVVLTDDATGFSSDVDHVIKFAHDFPTWWGKIELFNPNTFNTDQIFYMDLDTVIVGNIDEMVSYDGDFAGLRDFYALHSLGSGVMAWNKHKVSQIYDKFLPRSREIITGYQGGDQVWIDETKPSIEYLQDVYHRQIVSFKRHCMVNNIISIPDNAKIICFHGNPRPHTIQHELLKKYW